MPLFQRRHSEKEKNSENKTKKSYFFIPDCEFIFLFMS